MTNEEFIRKFFNSRDIADHCIAIGHELNLLEKAHVIYNSTRTMQEKLEGYHELLDTEPDMEVPDSFHHGVIPSLKEWLAWLVEYREAPARFDVESEKIHEDWHLHFLKDFFILIPTPFKRGDIVYVPPNHIEDHYNFYHEGPGKDRLFVLDKKLNLWTKRFYKEPYEIFGKKIISPYNWDDTDMQGEAVYQFSDEWPYLSSGGLYYDHMSVSYMDLEYYKGELEGRDRIFEYLSLFLKKELRVDEFVYAMEAIKYEEISKHTHSMMEDVEYGIKRKRKKKEKDQCQE